LETLLHGLGNTEPFYPHADRLLNPKSEKPHPDWNAAQKSEWQPNFQLRRNIPDIAVVQIINNGLAQGLDAAADDAGHIHAKTNDGTSQHHPVNGHSARFVINEGLEDIQGKHLFYSFQMVIHTRTSNLVIPASCFVCTTHLCNCDMPSNRVRNWAGRRKKGRKQGFSGNTACPFGKQSRHIGGQNNAQKVEK
jgi:hypothetical protein